MSTTETEFTTIPKAMRTLMVSRATLTKLIADAELTAVKVGAGHTRLVAEEIRALAARSTRPARKQTQPVA